MIARKLFVATIVRSRFPRDEFHDLTIVAAKMSLLSVAG